MFNNSMNQKQQTTKAQRTQRLLTFWKARLQGFLRDLGALAVRVFPRSERVVRYGLQSLSVALLIMVSFVGLSSAASLRAVPSVSTAGYDETFAVDIVAEGIPSSGLGTVQFRMTVSAPGTAISGVSDLSLGKNAEISVVSPLVIGPATATRSGIGDFFWNARSSNGVLAMDNDVLQSGSGLYSFSHTNGAALPSGSGVIARFMIKAATGVTAEQVTISLGDVALLNGDTAYSLDAVTGADIQLRCKTKMPSLMGLSQSDAISTLNAAQLSAGTIYEIDNTSGSYALNVVLEQSVPAGNDVFCGSSVNLAINTPPVIQVSNIAEGAILTADITPQITVTDTNLKSSAITLNGNPYTQGTSIVLNGTYTLAINAEDLLGNKSSLSRHFTMSKAPVAVGTGILSSATVSTAYSQTLSASGGTAPYTWMASAGTVPPGLALNTATGAISGIPTTVGMYPVTFQATDADQSSGSKAFVMSVNDITPQWMRTSGGSAQSDASAIALDEVGNAYVTGYSSNGSNNDYLTIKYDAAGNVLWSRVHDGNADERATGIAVDKAGNVLVTGYATDGGTNAYLTIKYDTNGNVLWTQKYDGGASSSAAGIAVDAGGNAYVTGTACGAAGCDIATIAYDPNGSLLWTQKYDSGSEDRAGGITVTAAGEVYVALSSAGSANTDYVTIKLNADGSLAWVRRFDSGSNDQAAGIAADSAGNVYVAGSSGLGNVNSYLTVKYDQAGNVLWNRKYESGSNDVAAGIAVDKDGNLYVAGRSSIGTNNDYLIVKLDASGNVIWTQRYDGGANEYATGIAVDAINNVYLTGYSRNADLHDDYLTIKYQKVGQGMAITTTALPIAVLNATYSKTLIALGGTAPYTWSVVSGALPAGLSLNAATGEISGTASAAASAVFTVRVTDAVGATADQTFTLIAHNAPVITNATLPSAVMGVAYSQALVATGGSGSYASWSLASGALPQGLALSQNGNTGSISGTPTQTGNYAFSVRVTDTDGLSSTKDFALSVTNVSITTGQLASGLTGFAYIQTLAATGGSTPYSWSISAGNLPAGLTLDGSMGVISGTPMTAGTYGITVQVADANNATSTKDLTIVVNDPLGAYLKGGSYIAAKRVLFKPREGVTVYCTIDGTDPDTSSAYLCAGPVLVSHALTLKYFATDASGNKGGLKTETYVITGGNTLAWGNNDSGQLGDGTSGTNRTAPLVINGLTGVVATSGGASHTVALRNDGTVWAWGNNLSGQLGDGTAGTNRLAPIQIPDLINVIAIATGRAHSLALKNDGTVWAWGNNDSGQLGDGTVGTNRVVPVQVTGLTKVADIASGADHSLAIRNDGTVWAWGNNASGQLGDGTVGTNTGIPAQVPGLSGIIVVTGGASHSLALKNDGTVWAWGNNDSGQLGDGTSGANRLAPVQVNNLASIINITAGASHSVAIKNDNTVWAWGNNDSGQLGDGTAGLNRVVPVQVNDITAVGAIAGGSMHSAALKNDGTVWAWGGNNSGQIGDGTTNTSRVPVQATGITAGDFLTAGNGHTLAITATALTIETGALTHGTTNALYNQSLRAFGGLAPYTWSVVSGTLPDGLALNSTTGAITGTPTTAGSRSITIQVADAGSRTAAREYTLAVYDQLTITTTSPLPAGAACASYTQTFAAAGGLSPYTWSVASGNLPGGLALDAPTGTLSGTLTSAGTYTFTAQAKDASSLIASKEFSLTVSDPLAIPDQALPAGVIGTAYNATLSVSGCFPPYTWSIITGTLPAGLTMNNAGVISGTPTTAGSSTVTVQVGDALNVTAVKTFNITVSATLAITTSSLATGATGTAYTQTLSAAGGTTPYTWSITSGALPTGLALNSTTGAITGTPTTAGVSNFTVQVADANSATATQALSITIVSPLAVSTTSLPNGRIGIAYNRTIAATGGVTPYIWSIATGSLPAGLNLNTATGAIAGTPTTAGASTFTVQVTDANSLTASRQLSIAIADGVAITTASLASSTVGVSYSQTLQAIGGLVPYTWSISSGSLPAGLALDGATGIISGTTTTAGTASFTVKVTDANAMTASKWLSIVSYNPVSITTTSLAFGTTGRSYSKTLTATGGKTPYTWSVTSGSLPDGLSMSTTGAITGTPTALGAYSFTVQATDSQGRIGTQSLSITVYQPLIVSTATLSSATAGVSYSQTLTASAGNPPYSWSISSGSLPSGLALDAASGIISGTTTTAGSIGFTVKVTDANAMTATKWLSIVSYNPVSITTTSLAFGTTGRSYSKTLTATGGKTPYTWSVASGSLPDGLSMSTTGAITGTPTTAGTYSFTVQATDSQGRIGTQSLSITVYQPLIVSTATLSSATAGVSYSQTLTASAGNPPYNWSISSGSLPAGLALDAASGIISGTTTTAGSIGFTVKVTDANAMTASKSLSIVSYNPVSITMTSLPFGTVGRSYSKTLTATGGKTPRTWTITTGSLPTGLTLNSTTGAITGTPTTAGTYSFTVQVTDSQGRIGTQSLSITVYQPLIVSTATLSSATAGVSYSQTLAASAGNPPYSWSISSGSLPSGLALDAASGIISGTTTTAGSIGFTVKVTDANASAATKWLSIVSYNPVSITTTSLAFGTTGRSYSKTLTATGGKTPYTWSVTSGSLPDGLSMSTAGAITGTPTTVGAYSFTVQATDSQGRTATQTLIIAIYAPLSVSTASLPNATRGTAYSQTLAATGGNAPHTWSIYSGSLPAGLSLDSSGAITGMATTVGSNSFIVRVTDSNGSTANKSLSIVVR